MDRVGDSGNGIASFPAALADRFVPVKLLASGSMGRVFHVREGAGGKPLAIKVILPAVADELNRVRFAREARVMETLSHPHIVRYAGADLSGPVPYVAMELLDGQTLASRLGSGPLPAGELPTMLAALLEGLGYLHRTGLLHRDIKPSNVFLDRARGPILIDFGLARRALKPTLLTAPGVVMASMRYVAPEVVRDQRFTAHSDLFGLGVLAFEALCGTGIHDDAPGPATMSTVLASLTSGTFYSAARRTLQAQGDLGRVILRALAPEPRDRYLTAAAMAAELERAG